VLQADHAEGGDERIVAPLAIADELSIPKARLAPRVEIDGTGYFVITAKMIALPSSGLTAPAGSLASYRSELVAAIDYLFLGV